MGLSAGYHHSVIWTDMGTYKQTFLDLIQCNSPMSSKDGLFKGDIFSCQQDLSSLVKSKQGINSKLVMFGGEVC